MFVIKYRIRRIGPGGPFDDRKEETIISSDGMIHVRRYDHHGPNGHYRLIQRAKGIAPEGEAERLYEKLMAIVYRHEEGIPMFNDTEAEVIIEEPGIKISVDACKANGEDSVGALVGTFMMDINLEWLPVSK